MDRHETAYSGIHTNDTKRPLWPVEKGIKVCIVASEVLVNVSLVWIDLLEDGEAIEFVQ